MKKGEVVLIFVLFIVVGLFALAGFIAFSKLSTSSTSTPNTVVKVIDGDTFDYYNGIAISRIRLLCVDTPEKGELGYEEAKQYLEFLTQGKTVTLESSVTDKDEYGRYLRYAYANGIFINKAIIKNKYGTVLAIPPENCSMFLP